MASESGQPTDGLTQIRQYGGSIMSVAGHKEGGKVVLTDKNLVFIFAQSPRKVVALRSIDRIESVRDELVVRSADSELARFAIFERTEREAWVKDINDARTVANQRDETIEDELLAGTAQAYSRSVGHGGPNWVYLAGDPNYPESFATDFVLGNDGLALTGANPPLLVPYQNIEGYELLPSKQLTTARIFLAGPLLASAWKKLEWFLCIRYKDDLGISLSLVFSPALGGNPEEFLQALYGKMRGARATPSS
jgi:hypothetical protein